MLLSLQALMIFRTITRKYVEEVIIAFDSDVAGQSATLRSLDLLIVLSNIKVLTCLRKDPDDYIKENDQKI